MNASPSFPVVRDCKYQPDYNYVTASYAFIHSGKPLRNGRYVGGRSGLRSGILFHRIEPLQVKVA